MHFEARAVDTAGISMEMPEGVTYALAENSKEMGTIDPSTGIFKAGDSTGTVTVNLMYQNNVVGETTIEVAVPDSIYFESEEVSLGFDDKSDLGIVMRSKGRDMNFKAGDIIWKASDTRLGKFEGNTFVTYDGTESLTGTITATSAYDENVYGELTVIVGKLPTIIWDFEDKVNEEGIVTQTAEDYYIGTDDKPGILSHSNYKKGGQESIEIASTDNDEPVRFGKKSLKLNYNFINCGEVTEGACVGTTDSMSVPGVPTGIGVWVYAPEGVGVEYEGEGSQAGFWLRGYVMDGSGNNKPYDFTLEPKNPSVSSGEVQPGIYWEGWKYLEADLTGLQAPYSIQPGMTFRLMYVAGTKMGTNTANSIYFDNFQFVYGTNVDDTDKPVVASVMANGTELEDNAKIKTDTITFEGFVQDIENKYTSGIDDTSVRIYIDGVNVVGNDRYTYAYSDGKCQVSDVKLRDGEHSITVRVMDKFGNETKETRYFTVDSGNTQDDTKVIVESTTENAIIGKTVNLQIKATDNTVTENTTIFKLGNQFKDYEIQFSQNYEGTVETSNLDKTITVNAKRKSEDGNNADAQSSNIIATLVVKVPTDLKETDVFTYTVNGGFFVTSDEEYATYFGKNITIPVGADYEITSNTVIIGGEQAVITVYDDKDKPVKDVSVYLSGESDPIGITDESGVVKTDKFNGDGATAKNYTIYAKDADGGLSFEYTMPVFIADGDAEGLPYNVRFNAVENLSTEKNITWFSNTLNNDKQILKYAEKGTDDWTTVEADTQQVLFTTYSNYAVNVNSVKIQGLKPDTDYEYIIGTKDKALDKAQFNTSQKNKNTSEFFIIGDIQDPDKSRVQKVAEQIDAKNVDYDFGIQIGDAIDQAGDYQDWKALGDVLGTQMLGDTNMINIMGNHEYYGDTSGSIASKIYNNPNTKEGAYYSFEQNDVYIAVINFSNTATPIREAAEWLIEDASKSDATWKILCMHQPPYYTNNGGNEPVYEAIPDAAEAAGIDVVFSGHDHTWAVTNPLIDDKVNQENGIVYYIVGAAGSKRYSPMTQDKFDYETIFRRVGEEYTATYFKVSSNQDQMTINVYDVNNGLLDTLTIDSECKKNGHDLIYDSDNKQLSCSVCDRVIEGYTGWAKDKTTDKRMLFINGKYQTGWTQQGEDVYYFNNKGLEQEIELKIDIKTDCTVRGYRLFECKTAPENEKEYRVKYQMAGGHEYEDVSGVPTCTVCGHERIKMSDCNIKLGNTDFTYTGKPIEPIFKVTTLKDGQEIVLKNGIDYYATIKDHTDVGVVTMTFTAQKVGIFVNVNEWRGNCEGSVDVTFTIHPELPKKATVINNGTYATLTWETSESAQQYVIYQSINGGEYKEIATATGNTYVVTDMNKEDTYKYRIGTRAVADGETIDSIKKLIPGTAKSELTIENRSSDGKPVICLNDWDNKAEYELYRSTSIDEDSFTLLDNITENGYADISAEPGNVYYYKIKAKLPDGTVKTTALYAGSAACEKPAVTASANPTDGKPVLSWDAVPFALKYEVYRSNSEEKDDFKLLWSGDDTSFTDTDAKAGHNYYYKVKAVSYLGVESVFSDVIKQTCDLSRPIVEKVELNDYSKPVIKWNQIEGADKYAIYRSESEDGTYEKISDTEETSYTDNSVHAGKIYYYKVSAVSDNSIVSSDSVSVACSLEMPNIVKTSLSENGKPMFEWNNVSGAVRYEIYRAEEKNGKYIKLAETEKSVYTDIDAAAEKSYYYKVRAVGASAQITNDSEAVEIKSGREIIDVTRVEGKNRFETAVASADALKSAYGIEKFDNILVAYGDNFADALAGSYLAKIKKAPILLVNSASESYVKDYIDRNLNAGGTVYILGGKGVVSEKFESSLNGYNIKRLGGADRFETNLNILRESEVADKEMMICSALSFADSLSAASTGRPILLVDDKLRDDQKEFLANIGSKNYYLIGGVNVVSDGVEAEINLYGRSERIEGANRYETSKLIAEKFFSGDSENLVIASGADFPDGLTGGPLAVANYSPIILVNNYNSSQAKEYANRFGVKHITVLGGPGAVTNSIVGNIISR